MVTRKILALAIVAIVAATACSRKTPPETEDRDRTEPPPVVQNDTDADAEAERRRAEERARIERERAMARLQEMIHFEFDRSALSSTARDILSDKAEILRSHPEVRLRIEGHADERGTVEYNLALGERRADAARAYLIDLGIDPDRLSTVSYGEERPLVPESNEAAWAQNRRDEFVPIGG